MEYFAHPWYMAFGGLLISVPIIIHLINRMRFKRIRWAAMEFLLKAQKKNQRRMIIEQLILLLLRILLVLLVGFLVARFLYGGNAPRGATHVILIDDSLSMNDMDNEGGKKLSAFDQAKLTTGRIIDVAAKANAAQNVQVYLLSRLEEGPIHKGLISNTTRDTVNTAILTNSAAGGKPTLLAGSPLPGLRMAREFFSGMKKDNDQAQPVVHLVSDFREQNWTKGSDAEALVGEVEKLLEEGTHVSLLDISAPTRGNQRSITHHDNLAIMDLRSSSRVAIEDVNVEFTAVVANFGTAPKGKGAMKVYVDGKHVAIADVQLTPIAAGQRAELKFTLAFSARKHVAEIDPAADIKRREALRRAERDFRHVRVFLADPEEVGLNQDNVRDMVIEVRRRVPALVVDGNKDSMRGDNSDIKHLQAFVVGSGVHDIEERKLADLKTADLDLYPSIVLLNVPEITDEVVLKKLSEYVNNGGSLCYFLGDQAQQGAYNELFKKGLFPVTLLERYDPLAKEYPDLKKRKARRADLAQLDPKPKVLFPKLKGGKAHPAVRRMEEFTSLFRYLSVNVYWRAGPKSDWDKDGKQTEPLIMLPNTEAARNYSKSVNAFIKDKIMPEVNKLADDAEFRDYPKLIDEKNPDGYAKKVSNAFNKGELYFVAEVLDDMLHNPGLKDKDGKVVRPSMADLWKAEKMKPLADQLRIFHEQILYGDPLMIQRKVGRGRVVAMLTTAGTRGQRGAGTEDNIEWNNWGSHPLLGAFYPLFLKDLNNYLISEGEAPNRLLGEAITFTVDAEIYDKKVTWSFQPQPDTSAKDENLEPETGSAEMKERGKDQLVFTLPKDNRKKPGVFFFTLKNGPKLKTKLEEVRAFAYNLDTAAESDLKRAMTSRLEPQSFTGAQSPGKGRFNLGYPGKTIPNFQEEVPDASESPWLYLFFILILVVEQALAVHLSYHLKPEELNAPSTAPTKAAA